MAEAKFSLLNCVAISHLPIEIVDLIVEFSRIDRFEWDYGRVVKRASLVVMEYGISGVPKLEKETLKLHKYQFIKASRHMSNIFPTTGKILFYCSHVLNGQSYLPGSTNHEMMVTKDRPFLRYRSDQPIQGYGYGDENSIMLNSGVPYLGGLKLLDSSAKEEKEANDSELRFIDVAIDYQNYTIRYENVETGVFKLYRISTVDMGRKRYDSKYPLHEDADGKYPRMKETEFLGLSPLIYTWKNAVAVYFPESAKVTLKERLFFEKLNNQRNLFGVYKRTSPSRHTQLLYVHEEDFRSAEESVKG